MFRCNQGKSSGHRPQIWLRRLYLEAVENETLTTIFRPGPRIGNHPKAFYMGELVRVKIIDQPGAGWANIYGKLLDAPQKLVVISDTQVLFFQDLQAKHFRGSIPEINCCNTLLLELALIYNLSKAEISAPGFTLTRTSFEYLGSWLRRNKTQPSLSL